LEGLNDGCDKIKMSDFYNLILKQESNSRLIISFNLLQLKYSDLYDVPRKLMAPQELRAGRQKTIQVNYAREHQPYWELSDTTECLIFRS